MKRLFYYLLFLIIYVFSNQLNAQNILVYTEDFENGPGLFSLNNGIVGANVGINKWIVNNDFTGAPIYPNTISQDSTVGGLINFAPFSNYLHVNDTVTSTASPNISNANFNPQTASDRFSSCGPHCTLGMDSVRIAFYVNSVGNANAYGELYYSADGGPWTAVSGAQFSGISKWTYVEFFNPDFNNRNNLQFGFRWVNSSTQLAPTGSMGVDGLRIVGKYDPDLYNVNFHLTDVSPLEVCKGDPLLIFFDNPTPLCGTGFYEVQLSNEFGDFSLATSLGIFQLNNLNTIQAVSTLDIPSNFNESACYKIRIIRGDIDPIIISDTSVCISVIDCPTSIITGGTAVISNPLDTVCVGSAIDTKFNSFGVFLNNTYVLQLSDSNGNFPPNPNVLGTSNDDASYPLIPPGTVSGVINAQNQPIPPGCNYYLRVNGTSPYTIGTSVGPFCIRECDIQTNNSQDVSFCVDDINGADTLLIVDIGVYPPEATYTPPNQFLVQVLDFNSLAIISTGLIGSVEAINDTVVQINIPNLPNLGLAALSPGIYYMRVVSTNSNQGWDQLGSIIRLTIGAPNPAGLSIDLVDPVTFQFVDFDLDTTICVNSALFFFLQPYDFNSTYVWAINNDLNFSESAPFNPVLFNGEGQYSVSVIETNFGCIGPGSEIANVTVVGAPNVSIIGPPSACVGDTVEYYLPLSEDTYYAWNSNLAQIVDSLNNAVNFYFPTSGSIPILVEAVNDCGNRNNSRNIIVRPLPNVDAGNDTTICEASTISLSTLAGSSYKFSWSTDSTEFSTEREVQVTPDSTTTYVIEVKSFGNLACTAFDTVTINVIYADTGKVKELKVCAGENIILAGDSAAISYLWNTGETAALITVKDTGWYYVTMQFQNELCPSVDSFYVKNKVCFQELTLPNAFSPNGDGQNDFFTPGTTFTYDEFYVKIYNRWGMKVHESVNPYFEWNGLNLAGNLLPDGTYFYIAAYKYQDKSKEFKGTVTLLK
jgi:gliding motility-associated-like protein